MGESWLGYSRHHFWSLLVSGSIKVWAFYPSFGPTAMYVELAFSATEEQTDTNVSPCPPSQILRPTITLASDCGCQIILDQQPVAVPLLGQFIYFKPKTNEVNVRIL